MRIVFFLLLIIHGLIHLLGFVKAYDLLEVKNLTAPISRPAGIVWLLCAALFLLAAFLFISKINQWWITAMAAVVLSQVAIIGSWQDAKIGTVANIIIAIVAIAALAEKRFEQVCVKEMQRVGLYAEGNLSPQLTTANIAALPPPVRDWIENSGALSKREIAAVYIKQKLKMKMKPDQEKWYPALAKQTITLDPPAFVWTVQMEMNPVIEVAGMDKFESGKGEMQMKLWSLFPVVKEKDNERIDLGTMQRYLSEIMWFPHAALHPDISWQSVDERTATATFRSGNNEVSGTFGFGPDGTMKSFTTMRYLGGDEDAQRIPWKIEVVENGEMNGLTIPVKLLVTWTLDSGDWTWLDVEVIEHSQMQISTQPSS